MPQRRPTNANGNNHKTSQRLILGMTEFFSGFVRAPPYLTSRLFFASARLKKGSTHQGMTRSLASSACSCSQVFMLSMHAHLSNA
eukprot:5773219-Amphidinium_carterae.1